MVGNPESLAESKCVEWLNHRPFLMIWCLPGLKSKIGSGCYNINIVFSPFESTVINTLPEVPESSVRTLRRIDPFLFKAFQVIFLSKKIVAYLANKGDIASESGSGKPLIGSFSPERKKVLR